jgi:exosome complex RNA-binding protein Rrp4
MSPTLSQQSVSTKLAAMEAAILKMEKLVTFIDMKTDIVFLGTIGNVWVNAAQASAAEASQIAKERENSDNREALEEPLKNAIEKEQMFRNLSGVSARYLDEVIGAIMQATEKRFPELGKMADNKTEEVQPVEETVDDGGGQV